MAGKSKSSSSGKKASSKSRPSSTSQLNTPSESSFNASGNLLCSFSPFNDWFASLTQSVDRHRLLVYSSNENGQLLADYIIPTAKCECLEWVQIPSPSSSGGGALQSQNTKKRRKRQSQEGVNGNTQDEDTSTTAPVTVLALGLSSGSIHLFNPVQGKVIRILSDSVTSTSSSMSNAVSSIAYDNQSRLFACLANGLVTSWDLNELTSDDEKIATPIASTQKYSQLQDSTSPYLQLVVLAANYIVLAHHSIAVYSLTDGKIVATYTGHASKVTHLVPISGQPARFASAAEGDRVVNIWLAPTEGKKTAKPLATLPLDAPVSHMSASYDDTGRNLLLVVTIKGSVRLYEISSDLDQVKSNGRKSAGIATLPMLTQVTLLAKQGDKEDLPAIDAILLQDSSTIKVARIAKGAKVAFDLASIRNGSGGFKSEVTITRAKGGPEGIEGEHLGGSTSTQRYTEAGTSSAQRNSQNTTVIGVNGIATGPDDLGLLTDDQANLDANIDDLEEPSLGQRLKSLRVGTRENGITEEEEDAEDVDEDEQTKINLPMGSLSLAQTLTQALHSNDAALLSTCLAHSDPVVIRSSVTRINGPLAVKLLEHCVDRMGRGGKRSRGALGTARTRGIIEWVRATLIAHTGYLMSLPKLVHRLSALHSTLSSRLASHERLLALNGRLELVLGQIEMRAAYTAQQAIKIQGVKSKGRQGEALDHDAKKKLQQQQQSEGKQWIEESSSEEEENDAEEMDVDDDDDDDEETQSDDADELDDVIRGEEEGETQDIALGNDTLGNTSMDSEEEGEEEAEGDSEEGEDEEGNSSMDEEEEEEQSDESALDEEGDSDEVEEEEEEDSEEDVSRGGLLDIEAESTDGEGSEESEE